MADALRPGSNFDTRETALLEALWRGDELAAVLAAARAELDAVHRLLARAEEAVAELGEIGDAAQAAIDELRARAARAEAEAALYLSHREALAAELFGVMRQREAAGGSNETGKAGRNWWRRAKARAHALVAFRARRS